MECLGRPRKSPRPQSAGYEYRKLCKVDNLKPEFKLFTSNNGFTFGIVNFGKINRRDFLEALALQLAGLSGTIGAVVEPAKKLDETQFFKEIRNRLTAVESEAIADAFVDSSKGMMLLYYQLFFPIYIKGGIVKKIEQLQEIKNRRLKDAPSARTQRLRVLPAMAAAHSLAFLITDDAESKYLQDLICASSQNHLNPKIEPNQSILGTLWRNMNAALLRSSHSWKTFTVGKDIIKAAEAVCLSFLLEAEETLPLLSAALSAWQFLLNYKVALLVRRTPDIQLVEVSIANINNLQSPRNLWLKTLTEIHSSCSSYENIPPQSFEALIGRRYSTPGSASSQMADFFALVGLQMWYCHNQFISGEIKSPYYETASIALEMQKTLLSFYANYGITASGWGSLKKTPMALLLSKGAVPTLDNIFNDYKTHFDQSELERKEQAVNLWLSKSVPFRQLEEVNVSEKVFSRRKALFEAIIGVARDIERRLAFWMPVATYTYERTRLIDNDSDIVNLEESLYKQMPLGDQRYLDQFSLIEDIAHGELVQKVTITKPASLGPAGAGVVEVPQKRNQMTTKPRISQEKAQAYANLFILSHYGERLAAGIPQFRKSHNRKAWVAPLFFRIKSNNIREVGEITVHANTGRVIEPMTREELRSRVQAFISP